MVYDVTMTSCKVCALSMLLVPLTNIGYEEEKKSPKSYVLIAVVRENMNASLTSRQIRETKFRQELFESKMFDT